MAECVSQFYGFSLGPNLKYTFDTASVDRLNDYTTCVEDHCLCSSWFCCLSVLLP